MSPPRYLPHSIFFSPHRNETQTRISFNLFFFFFLNPGNLLCILRCAVRARNVYLYLFADHATFVLLSPFSRVFSSLFFYLFSDSLDPHCDIPIISSNYGLSFGTCSCFFI
jgi:hypothetical protein